MRLPGLTIPCVLWMMSKPLVHLYFHCCLLYPPYTVWKFIFFKYSALATFLLSLFSALTTAEREGLLFFSYIQRDMVCQDRKGGGSSRNLAVHIFINMQRMQGRKRKERVREERRRWRKREAEMTRERKGECVNEEKRKRGELGLGLGYVCSEPTLMTYFLQQDTTSAVPPTRD